MKIEFILDEKTGRWGINATQDGCPHEEIRGRVQLVTTPYWKTKCAEFMQEILMAIPLDKYANTVELNMELLRIHRKFINEEK